MKMIRNQLYWAFDRIRGSKVHDSLESVQNINLDPYTFSALKKQEEYLNGLLSHAVKKTAFYKNYYAFKSINDFPVINKQVICNNYNGFISEKVIVEKLKRISTSGSTGIPFVIYQDVRKTVRNSADNIFYSQMCGYMIGDPLYYLRIWTEENSRSKLAFFLQHITPINMSDLSDKSLESITKSINKMPPNAVLLAYGSTYEAIASYCIRNSVAIKSRPKVALTMSDSISNSVRLMLQALLNCPVYSRYSNAENGFLGHQWCMETEDYLINTASYYIELLNFNNNEPVKDGMFGRVVVTDLFNYSVPIIRYDTGDIAIRGSNLLNGKIVPTFKSIEGRRLDFISNVNGDLISPHTIDYALRSLPKLIQFQLIQKESNRFVLNLILSEKFPDVEEKARLRLKKYLGNNAIIDVEYKNEMPTLDSGKRKIVVNEFREKHNS